jgi:TonB family protein
MRLPLSPFFLAILVASPCLAQAPTPVTRPLGDTLTKAVEASSLTTPGSHPFHVRLHIHDATDIASTMQADIEEFWMSPVLWKRTVTAAGLQQTTIVNETGTHVETTGDYFPLWLRGFVTALFDPVPNLASWNRPGAELQSMKLASGQFSSQCLNQQQRVGDDSPSMAANICFFGNDILWNIDIPGYSMEFNKFMEFHKKHVASLYMSHQELGHFMVGKIEKLEDLNKPSIFFAASPASRSFDSLASISLDQPQLMRLVPAPVASNWPPVSEGKSDGKVTIFLSMDRTGKIRESRVVTSDNRELNSTALALLENLQGKTASVKGNPIQVVGALTIPFSTSTVAGGTLTEASKPLSVSGAVQSGHMISGTNPHYPPDVKAQGISGTVYLRAVIGKDGTVTQLGVIDSPAPSLTKVSIDAVRTWKFTPYLINGAPVTVDTTITVNFNIR